MNITICGGGWLGQPLAHQLRAYGHRVIATSRTPEGAQQLTSDGIPAGVFTLGDAVPAELTCDLLILNIPPNRGALQHCPTGADAFVSNVTTLIKQLCGQNDCKLIFISTSAVYGDAQGCVTERSPVAPQTPSAKAHVRIEQFIDQQLPARASILRLAGLVGPLRHPVNYLAGKEQVPNGLQPVNLIHQVDVIKAITQIIERQVWGQVLHLSATDHPSRQAYYCWAAYTLGLIPPQFVHEHKHIPGKVIDASYSLEQLALELAYASPYVML